MKKIISTTLLLTIGLSMACSSAANGNGGIAKSDNGQTNNVKVNATENKPQESKKPSSPQILWDFRKTELNKAANFSKAETNAVVQYLFGESNSKIEIRSRLSGSFTKPNAKETLYYLTGCKDGETGKFTTDCPHVAWDSEGWIAIYDGTTPVLKINEPLGFSVDKVTDVNEDGKNEILSFSGYGQSGIQTTGMSLGEISDGKYTAIKGFDGWADDCGYGETLADNKKKAVASVITYSTTTDGTPNFEEEYFETGCENDEPDKSAWKKTTKTMFDEFVKSVS